MGLENNIKKIIERLEERSGEIVNVLIISTKLNVQSWKESLSVEDIFFAAKLFVAVEATEDAINDKGIDFETIKIESAGGSSVIIKKAGAAIVVVEVTKIIPGKPLGFLTESGPKGTIGHINDAVEKIKAVLSEQ